MAGTAEETFTNALGDSMTWDDSWRCLAQIDPEIFQASVNLMAVPRKKNHLSAKMQALVALTVDSNSTHLYTPGIRLHVKAAAAAGATKAEVLEVLELASTLGVHACNIGIPTLVQVLKEENMYDSHPTAGKPFNEKRLALKEDFTAKRGYWHSFWEDFLALDPEFFEAYTEFSSVPWTRRISGITDHAGALPPQDKELIYCAFDAAATHLYVSGLREHMRNALRYGATAEQILEVLEIATRLSLHTLNVAAPIVQDVYMWNDLTRT